MIHAVLCCNIIGEACISTDPCAQFTHYNLAMFDHESLILPQAELAEKETAYKELEEKLKTMGASTPKVQIEVINASVQVFG